ncbi:MAG TPA: peptidoglycan-binding protein [Leptolyngbyaceae cyanobacterium M33_DOE_097]|uniref:SH3b domain-containing protein n=1 Tax=Oscillatoriales cyanobacterium SpSt-418 TaxID=2282169 RepID=A0A7C3PFJ9_9CYAN|nr:peptidoglycan-binding protein [Leptolyngbyaceae cyanobacterium M33_DOE_097]
MRKGDRGPGVSRLQESLVIRADGVFGSNTYSSVRSFQARNGLTVDGIAGPQTLRALGLPANLGPGGGSDRPISGRAYVTGSVVNVRSSPSGRVVGKAYQGARVSLTGRTATSGGLRWSQLTSGNWMASRYLSSSSSGSDRPISGGAVITGNGVRVRDYPYGPVRYSLNSGARVSLTGRNSFSGGRSWVQITDGNWVAREFVKGASGGWGSTGRISENRRGYKKGAPSGCTPIN